MNKSELLKRFGKNLKIERIRKDLTQEQLSEKMGVSRTYLASIEGGKENMSLAKVLELANYLEVDIKTLLDFS